MMELVSTGSVCDIYRITDFPELMFFWRTNRYSVRGRIFPGEIPYKGLILNQMSIKWMELLEKEGIVGNHIITADAEDLIRYGITTSEAAGCVSVAKQCIPIPIHCIVRGYYIPESESWDVYKRTGSMCGNILPKGLKESQQLAEPIFTPTIKSSVSKNHKNITFEKSIDILTDFVSKMLVLKDDTNAVDIATFIANDIRKKSLDVYAFAHQYAINKGIILADTKLDFGLMLDQEKGQHHIVLINEVLTPETSRYWDAKTYKVGHKQLDMDKQYLIKHVFKKLNWNVNKEIPDIDSKVKERVSNIYSDIYERLFMEDVITLSTNITWEWKNATEKILKENLDSSVQKEIEVYLETT